jgi:hypothetical protein
MLAVRTVNDHCRWPCGTGATRIVRWHGPGPGTDQDCSDISQTVPELLTRFGADGWELVALQEHREGGMSTSYWDAARSAATYTFKRPVRSTG